MVRVIDLVLEGKLDFLGKFFFFVEFLFLILVLILVKNVCFVL